MKHLTFILLLLTLATAAFAVTATWTSITDRSWQNPLNWNPHGVPISSTDVIIPGTYPLSSPLIYAANAYCNNITIESNNFLEVTSGYSLTVNGTMTMNGDLSMSGTGGVSISGAFKCYGQLHVAGTGALTVSGNAYWYSGSSIVDDSDTQLKLFKDMYIYAGAGFIMNNGGKVSFFGSGPSDICNYEDTTQFGNLIAAKSTLTGYLNIRYDTTEPFKIKNNLENNSGSIFHCSKDLTFTVLGNVIDWNSGDTAGAYGIKWIAGTLKMDGASQYLDMQGPGCYLNHLISSATVGVVNEYDLIIKGNLTIERGYLSADGFITITIAGNWNNQVGASGFWENSGRVIFNSSGHQSILSNETFNILEVANVNALRFTSGKTVTCAKYDWTSGGIDMNTNATFTATDLADPGIYGGWWLTNTSGVINISNENVDLKGSITITSGTFNVNSAALYSLWNSYDNVKLTMSGGTLDFHDTGIQVYNIYGSPNPTLIILAITGGTIKTAKNFEGTWAGFAPTGGTVEFYGSSSSTLGLPLGNFYNLKITKTGGASAILAGNNFTLGGNLTVSSGILNAMTYQISCVSAYITGTLIMNTKLDCSGSLVWNNGSLATVANNSIIECGGDWFADSSSNVQLNSTVKVYFTGTAARNITIKSATHSFGQWKIGEDSSGAIYTGGVYSVAAASTQNLTVPGLMYIRVGNSLDLNQRSMNITHELNLWGTLIIDSGTVTVNGVTTVPSTGVINIDTGTLYLVNRELSIPVGAVVTLASGTIKCDGFSINGTFQPTGGTVILYSTNNTSKIIYLAAGNWMPNLTVDALFKTYHLASNITIKGSFTLDYGQFSVQHLSSGMVYDMYVAENWWNNLGPSHFIESTGRVIFNGPGFQAIKTNETFNIIEVNKVPTGTGGDALRIESGYPDISILVTCNVYDWAAGALDVSLRGTFTALDLADNGLYGDFCCNTGCVLNLTQDAAQSIDLFGEIHVTGGAVNVFCNNPTVTYSNWPASTSAWIDISSGSLNFRDKGIHLQNGFTLAVNITGGTISMAGNFLCDRGSFSPAGGTFAMIGAIDATIDFNVLTSSFYSLLIDKSSASARVELISGASTPLICRGYFTVNRGDFYMNREDLSCSGDIDINNGGKMSFGSYNFVRLASDKNLNVNTGGHIYVNGAADQKTTFTHISDGYYNFNVFAGGELSANYVIFEYTGIDGVYIQPGATIGGLNNCTFQNGVSGGTLFKVENNQNLTVTYANFPSDAGSGAKNVCKSVNEGNVYFSNYLGSFSGAANENDPNHRIFWLGSDVNLQITNVTWTRPDNYVCAPITAEVTVENIGTNDIIDPFRVDLYKNRSTVPPTGTLGNLYLEIPNLDGGQSKTVTFTNVSTDIPGTWRSWARVDANQLIPETSEGDNLYSTIPNTTWQALPPVTELTVEKLYSSYIKLQWSYTPVFTVNIPRFNIYRSADPYFTPSSTNFWTNTGYNYANDYPVDPLKFYIIQAVRNLP